MNLERIETLCLNFLKQAPNPLVPIGALLEFCSRDDEAGEISRDELLRFLRSHAEVQVMDGPEEGDPVGTDTFASAGFDMGTRAILNERIPTPAEMHRMLAEQAREMISVLEKSSKAAREAGDTGREAQIAQALERAQSMLKRIDALLGAPPE